MSAGVLVGRRLTITALHSAVDRAMSGAGGVALLVGDAGMGKTALAAEAMSYARTSGAGATWGACWEGAGTPGYWPWIQLTRELGGDAMLATLSHIGSASTGLLADDAAARFRTYDAILGYLREKSRQRPLMLVLDDLHWADLSSLRVLLFLARNVRDAAVLIVGTYRDVDVADEQRALLAEIAGQAEVLYLSGLSVGDVGELLEQAAGAPPPVEVAKVVHERAGGNPFFVQQIARLLAAQDGSLAQAHLAGVPPAVGQVLARRMARLPQDVARLLDIAAVVGTRFSIAMIAAIAGIPVTTAVSLIDVASRARIVEWDGSGAARFGHDLFREVLYDALPGADRSTLHLAVADALKGDAPAAQIAHHRVAALPLGDRDRAIAALIRAGREALAHNAFDEAIAQFRRAVELAGGNEGSDLVLMCEYADALRRGGRGDEARGAFFAAADRARGGGDPAVLARVAFGAHCVPTRTESLRSDVIALLEEALAAAARPDPLLLAALARELADGPHRDPASAGVLADSAVAAARADADSKALAYGLFALADVRWERGAAHERLGIAGDLAEAADAAGETELLLEAYLAKMVALLELGDPEYAVELDAFVRLAERAAIPRYVYLARSRQAMHASLTGPFELADRLIESAAGYGERIGEPDVWGVQASQLVGLAFLRHDWTRLSALAESRGEPLTPPEFAPHEHAWRLVEAGDTTAAAAILATIPDRSAHYRWRSAALLTAEAELAAVVADEGRCVKLYDQLLPMATEFAVVGAAVFTTGPVALQLGLLAAALKRRDDAVAHLRDAVTRAERLGAHLHADRARTELDRVLAEQQPQPAFRRDGELWTLGFSGRTVRMRDAKGLRDLAVLLALPGREVAAGDLLAGGMPALGADPVLDEQARTAYRSRLADLDHELAAADAHDDVERSTRLAAERDALLDELSRATGLAGRRRRLGDSTERARTTVTARIRDSIGRIERVHPELGRHLRASISTGSLCVYRPGETVRWTISQT